MRHWLLRALLMMAWLQLGTRSHAIDCYRRGGRHTAPSNEAFDEQLRAQDPAWGVRDLEVVENVAMKAGFNLQEFEHMPANNLSVVFRK